VSAATRPLLDDPATRQLAQDEFATPIVVEAGAGTGKTALLVARVAAWCVGAGWEKHAKGKATPGTVARAVSEGVTAITFTEAAAAEMATRIGEALAGLAHGNDPIGWVPGKIVGELEDEEIRVRSATLCGEIHRLSVTTIHAFCQRILAAHPFDAGLHPHFEIDADGLAIEALVDEVVEGALRELEDGELRIFWERLAVDGFGPAEVADALRLLVAAGATPGDLQRDPFDPAAAEDVLRALKADVKAFLLAEDGRLADVPGVKNAVHARAAVAELAIRLAALDAGPSFETLAETAEIVDAKALKRLRDWSKGAFGVKELARVDEVRDEVVRASGQLVARLKPFADLDLEAFGAARRLLGALLERVEERRLARGLTTFTDLLERTAELFEGHPSVCRAERQGMDQLLVDEFQDTDDVQCRIVTRLALDGPEDRRPGLFVVGDPKQSIYAWRSADLEAYDGFVRSLLAAGGVRGPLTKNFRSVEPILDEVGRVVGMVMHPEDGLQPPFEDLEATEERVGAPGFDRPPWSAVEHWIEWPPGPDGIPTAKKQKQDDINALEAEAIAADIRRIHDEIGVGWGEFAVLLRATTAQNVLLEAFRRWGVRFEVAREREFYRQREIIEAAALVRAIIESADALALLTVLRSDVVGVPDAALAPLWDAGLPAAAASLDGPAAPALTRIREIVASTAEIDLDAPGADLVPDWADALVGALEILAELRRSMREDPPDIFVEELRTLWLAEISAAARDLGRFRRARLDAFLHDLESTLVRGADGGASLARFLRRSVEEGREVASTAEPDRRSDAVHVMTIYGAKGLDFEHVYLAQTHKKTGGYGAPPQAVLRRFEGRPELKLFAWKSPGFDLAERRRELQASAEKVRLLYVAMTRAKQRLVVSGCWPAPGVMIEPRRASTLADLVAHRGDPELVDGLIEEKHSRRPDAKPCVGWYMPALEERSLPSGVSGGLDEVLASDTVVAEDATAIAEARTAAAARMAAPWSRAASAAAHRLVERRESEIEESVSRISLRPGIAVVVGTTVHRLLEELDLDRDLAEQLEDRRGRLEEVVADRLDPDLRQAGVERLAAILDGLAGSRCLGRLAAIAEDIAARELDVLLPPADDDGTSVVAGAVDLVYTDPDDGRLVVADYKTDAVATDEEISQRVEKYRPQLETYARAIEEALDLDHRPGTELWFLDADRIVRL